MLHKQLVCHLPYPQLTGQKLRVEVYPPKTLGSGAGRKQLLKHNGYQHCRSFPHWRQLCLGNCPLQSGSSNEQWAVVLSPSIVLNAKTCLGGHSLTRREWGGESEVTILLVFNDQFKISQRLCLQGKTNITIPTPWCHPSSPASKQSLTQLDHTLVTHAKFYHETSVKLQWNTKNNQIIFIKKTLHSDYLH